MGAGGATLGRIVNGEAMEAKPYCTQNHAQTEMLTPTEMDVERDRE